MADVHQAHTDPPPQTFIDMSRLTWIEDLDQLTFSQYMLYLCQACTSARDMPIRISPSKEHAWRYTVSYKVAAKTYTMCCSIKELPKVVEEGARRLKKREDEDEEDYFIEKIMKRIGKMQKVS